jgi:antitoxin component of MazEF toxin-antitoxin module
MCCLLPAKGASQIGLAPGVAVNIYVEEDCIRIAPATSLKSSQSTAKKAVAAPADEVEEPW